MMAVHDTLCTQFLLTRTCHFESIIHSTQDTKVDVSADIGSVKPSITNFSRAFIVLVLGRGVEARREVCTFAYSCIFEHGRYHLEDFCRFFKEHIYKRKQMIIVGP